MKRVFLEMYLQHNLGDDLFLYIIAKRYPNCKFTIDYYDHDYKKFIGKFKNIETRVTLKNRILRKLKIRDYINNIEHIVSRNDVLVFLSGSYFMEPSHGKVVLDMRNKLIDAFKSEGKPVYILGTNFGPYKSQNFYNNYKELFKKCDDVCFRDEYSYNLFKKLKNVRKANDIVLGLDVDNYKKNKKQKQKIVGFSIIDMENKIGMSQYGEDYINSTKKSIEMFIKKGYKCILMSFCEKENDLKIINKIISLVDNAVKDKIYIYEYKYDLEEAINLISIFDVFIAARFHANILGLLLDIPTIPIIYSKKTMNVLTDLGLKDIAIEMKDLKNIYNDIYIMKRIENGNRIDKKFKKMNNQFEKLDEILG